MERPVQRCVSALEADLRDTLQGDARTDMVLPPLHLAAHPRSLPLHPYLLAVCGGGYQEIRSFQRRLARAQTHTPLQPLGRLGLRPRALNRI